MAVSNEIFELNGTADLVNDRKIIRLDQESSDKLPSRGQVAVELLQAHEGHVVVIDPDGRRGHWLALDGQGAPQLLAEAGDQVELTARVARTWPETGIPQDLASALGEAGDLDEMWAGLTAMARWEWVRWIGATKNPSTRERRVEASISKLRDGKRRPCCFDLSSCTDPEVSKSGKLIQ
ncbi:MULTISPECIES: YdeI/OmpD-associated family protein [Micrococcaceae]|uniref:YdeI/OmpD-associated family protein n=1 Tax=Micrococcaceae TaxID=1268 RepID=UPI000CFCE81F|nr:MULTISPECIES: YdeI/OmpD-associated family protein [unclassified Arthrobacter]MCS3493931.1 hypothetical protein [Arthrobacter sp. JUb119]PQZ85363.1 hypothetical protein CQ016_13940 [Arthrobacter sp. MYb222]PRB75087.1 hypothetical protein CQ012_11090 [Arthrobacter sp. MYb214]